MLKISNLQNVLNSAKKPYYIITGSQTVVQNVYYRFIKIWSNAMHFKRVTSENCAFNYKFERTYLKWIRDFATRNHWSRNWQLCSSIGKVAWILHKSLAAITEELRNQRFRFSLQFTRMIIFFNRTANGAQINVLAHTIINFLICVNHLRWTNGARKNSGFSPVSFYLFVARLQQFNFLLTFCLFANSLTQLFVSCPQCFRSEMSNWLFPN